jgi:hypothetical protein
MYLSKRILFLNVGKMLCLLICTFLESHEVLLDLLDY